MIPIENDHHLFFREARYTTKNILSKSLYSHLNHIEADSSFAKYKMSNTIINPGHLVFCQNSFDLITQFEHPTLSRKYPQCYCPITSTENMSNKQTDLDIERIVFFFLRVSWCCVHAMSSWTPTLILLFSYDKYENTSTNKMSDDGLNLDHLSKIASASPTKTFHKTTSSQKSKNIKQKPQSNGV